MHIGVIASMKRGMEHFVYRELSLLEEHGATISLFPTKVRRGLYEARDSWKTHRWNPLTVLLLQPLFFLSAPLRYARLFCEALRIGGLVDFFVAWYFARSMAAVDVIYATFGDHKLFIGYFCKRIVGKPLTVTIHAYELYQNPNPRLFLRALEECDQIVTVTEYNREYLQRHFGVDPARVEIVRCCVGTHDYRPDRKFVVLIVAFFGERKGHEVLLRAVKRLESDDVEVWVVGDKGPESRTVDVQGLVRKLGLESRVAFFGALNGTALKAVYRACDAFCLPSRTDGMGVSEGFPVSIVEAMAFGKPVITTRHVEIPRILEEVLVEENDVEGLARAIDLVYRSESLRRRLGEENRRLAERVFSLRNVARKALLLQRLARPDRNLEGPAPAADYHRSGAARQVNVQAGPRSAAEI